MENSNALSKSKRERWIETLESVDMAKSSQKAWQLLRRLNNDATKASIVSNVTSNEIAHQLLKNGKTNKRKEKVVIDRQQHLETSGLSSPFKIEELREAIKRCKKGKAPGVDDMMVEQIQHFGIKTLKWLLAFYNNCLKKKQIPKIWRKTKVIAILKPGKDAANVKNYRPISLLCHLYKVLERMLLTRLNPKVEPKLIPQQAGFRPNKNCTAQVANLTQFIEDGYERGQVTGVVFVDLSAAYDTVLHNIMMSRLYNITGDYDFTCMVHTLLQNRMFYVEFQNRKSRWRVQKNGLPQGSVLSPTLFNIYTNDQPQPPLTSSFIYADDLALATQSKSFEQVEHVLTTSLEGLAEYYDKSHLKPNPSKTQVCAFHLKNKQAYRKLKVEWRGVELEHTFSPKYLGVTLDRALTYKKHCMNTKQKVHARNNIVRKLTSSNWGAYPSVVRTSALALCYSAAEYACPVWQKSVHAKQVDVALNETCRIVTGCLRATPINKLQCLAGIAPPKVRREVAANAERYKMETNVAHPLYGHQPPRGRLKSRKSFLQSTVPLNTPPSTARLSLWQETLHVSPLWRPSETLPPGGDLKWKTWRSLNRLRSGVGRTRYNMARWNLLTDPTTLCECGEQQTTEHLYNCTLCPESCTIEDLLLARENAIQVAVFWSDRI